MKRLFQSIVFLALVITVGMQGVSVRSAESAAELPAEEAPDWYVSDDGGEELSGYMSDDGEEELSAYMSDDSEEVPSGYEQADGEAVPEEEPETGDLSFSEVQEPETGDISFSEVQEPEAVKEDLPPLLEEAEPEETVVLPDDTSADNEELFEMLAEAELYEGIPEDSVMPEEAPDRLLASEPVLFAAFDGLSSGNQVIYDLVTPGLKEIANGTRSYAVFDVTDEERGLSVMTATAEELGVDSLTLPDGSGGRKMNPAATAALKDLYSDTYTFDIKELLRGWVADLPLELYWFDKTKGIKAARYASYQADGWDSEVGDYTTLTISGGYYRISFNVAEEYADSSAEYTVDQSSREALDTAVATAASIVEAYASLSDYDKLDAYRNEICSMVSYYSAASDASYGNPWQLIWVFDGDDSTNVVCEGYAKAFQYLSQLSDFESSLTEVRMAIGKMGRSSYTNHMWNIVTMEDGRNYLADLTNCDTGKAGADRLLFLCGGEGSVTDGYACKVNSGSLNYVYDEYTIQVYGESGLTLAGFNYIHDHVPETVPGTAAKCEEAGLTDGAICSVCGKVLTPQQEIPATGHTFGSWTVKTAATTKAAEVQHRTCTVCGKEETKTVGSKLPVAGYVTDPTSVAYRQQQILNDGTVSGVTYVRLQARAVNAGKYAVRLVWNEISGADGYIIYGGRCGWKMKRIDSVKGTISVRMNLVSGAYYRYRIVAYKLNANGTQRVLTTSAVVFEATKGGKVTNPASVSCSKTSVSVKAGKSVALTASVKPVDSGLKLQNIRAPRFVSADPNTAAVTVDGKVTGKKKGTCYIYAYAQNGLAQSVKVTVT